MGFFEVGFLKKHSLPNQSFYTLSAMLERIPVSEYSVIDCLPIRMKQFRVCQVSYHFHATPHFQLGIPFCVIPLLTDLTFCPKCDHLSKCDV